MLDVLRLDLALEDGELALHKLRSPLPLHVLRVALRPERVLRGGEVLIDELMLAIQRLLDIELLVGHDNREAILGDEISDPA